MLVTELKEAPLLTVQQMMQSVKMKELTKTVKSAQVCVKVYRYYLLTQVE